MLKAISIIKYWAQIFVIPIYGLSFLWPRNKKIWVFGSTFGNRFADNPKYLYLYLNQNNRDVRPIWVSKKREIVTMLNNQGYEAYYLKSFRGIWFCLLAKVYLFDNYSKDISFILSGGALKINLWHGIPLKKINHDNRFDLVRHPKNLRDYFKTALRRMSDEKPSHYVLTTSDFLLPIFSSAFQTKNVLTSGYPRNDTLVQVNISNMLNKEESEFINVIEKMLQNDQNDLNDHMQKKLILYMPTFRESETKFFECMDMITFQNFLEQTNCIFCIKLHPKSKLQGRFQEIRNDNIMVIPAATDPYIILNKVDILITDYSSIYFDFLLTDKPIVFFPYDFKEYTMNSRDMYFDYDEFTPGNKVFKQSELQIEIDKIISGNEDNHTKYRDRIRNLVFDKVDGSASERLYEDIKQIIG
ncbi:MAG: CDP-glycerol glycerophosphotransferase family protein [Herbinix sp.]|nr:CDP-glycerol glycerophosphotransferase family protein [Herbinix sp.]